MLLTALIPAHNASATLAAAITSILEQDFQDFELWILENGSTDTTLELAQSFASSKVKVFDLGPVGFQKALSWGIENAKTPYIARMDADDICMPHRFSVQVSWLESHPEHVLCGSDVMVLTPFDHIIEERQKSRYSEDVAFEHMSNIPGKPMRYFGDPTVVFRREAAIKVGLYDERFPVGDVSLWIRMLKNHQGYQLAEPLLVYRWVPKSMSNTLAFNVQTLACRKEYFGDFYGETIIEPTTQSHAFDDGQVEFWKRVALAELLAGDGSMYQQAWLQTGCSFGWLERMKVWMLPVYRRYHQWRFGVTYIRRKDLETRFIGGK